MDRDIFRRIIVEGQETVVNIELVKRPFQFEPNGNYVFVGVRQAGKSYLLYQRIQQLIEEGENIERMVYINFDDERIIRMKAEELDFILQAYHSLYDYQPIFFFDEIQNVDGWEHFARRLANQKYRVYITGSNAKMLSRDIATTLGGRYWCEWVYPYSFNEYLSAQGIELKKNWLYSRQVAEISKSFNNYFQFGGFPELVNVVAKRIWLNNIFGKIFFSDLVVRNSVRNEEALRLAIKRLAECVKQPTPYNRIANLIKTVGVSVSTGTIIDFARYFRDACLIFSLDNYAAKFVEKESIKKHYFVDNGLLTIFLTDAETFLLENICAIHLYKKFPNEGAEQRLFYYLYNIEVDFYIPEIQTGIQVCYTLQDENTYNREVQALVKLKQQHPLQKMLIVTRDEERTITLEDGNEIEVIPVWKWLLLF